MPPRAPRWLLYAIVADGLLLGGLVATGFFGAMPLGDEAPTLWIFAGLVLAVYVGMALWLATRPTRRAWGSAIALYIFGLHIAGGWLALLALGLGMSSGPLSGGDLQLTFACLALLIAQLLLAAVTYWWAKRAGVESVAEETGRGIAIMYVSGFALLVVGLVVGIEVEYRLLKRSNQRVDRMRAAIFRVEGCAAQYAATDSTGAYPSSLGAMGPAGTRCLDESTAGGRAKDIIVRYRPVTDDGGRVTSFVVTSRRKKKPTKIVDELAGDSSGLAGFGEERRFGGSLFHLGAVRGCVERYLDEFPGEPLPKSLLELMGTLERRGAKERDSRTQRGCVIVTPEWAPDRSPRAWTDSSLFDTPDGHRLTYRPEGERDYVVEARPREYGVTAVRSYVARHAGVHLTLQDRAATAGDASVRSCEYEESSESGNCIYVTGAQPRVDFVHDSVVTEDSSYTLVARDARPTTARGDSLLFRFECDARHDASYPHGGKTATEERCRPLKYSMPPNRRAVVRLWAVDRSGAAALVEDTMRVTP